MINPDLTRGTTLYDNSTGSTGTITLSDSASNYNYIELYYYKSSTYGYSRIKNPNNKNITLNLDNWFDSNSLQSLYKKILISNTSISVVYAGYINIINGSVSEQGNSNDILITNVIGYK